MTSDIPSLIVIAAATVLYVACFGLIGFTVSKADKDIATFHPWPKLLASWWGSREGNA